MLDRSRRCLGTVAVVLVLATGCDVSQRPWTADSATATAVPAAVAVAAEADLTSGPFLVTKIVDGDTLWVKRDGQNIKLRLIGIDTPETHDPPVQCFGEQASAQATTMLDGQLVLLETDPTQGAEDKYGRELVYVWTATGQLFNLEMIRLGFAHEYTYDLPYKYRDAFAAAEHDARVSERGLWAPDTCGGDTTKPAG